MATESFSKAPSWLENLTVVSTGSSTAISTTEKTLRQFGARILHYGGDAELGSPEIFETADVVLVDRTEVVEALPGLPAGPAADYLSYVTAHNRAVWVTISPFGIAGDRADDIGSELSIQGAGGFLGHSRFSEDLPPTISPGSLGLKTVGIAAAVAALHAVHTRIPAPQPLHVDVSAQAVLISTGVALEMGHVLARCPDAGGSLRYGAPTGFFHCRDGSVYVVVLEQHQWEGFRGALAPGLDSITTLEEARDRADEVNEAMSDWVRNRYAAEAERLLQDAGVPCTSVNSVKTFVERTNESVRAFEVEGPTSPALPAVISQVAKEPVEGSVPLSELRVLDAGNVLAVPLGAAWLGAMGARVTKLEDPARLDVYRRRGPFAAGEASLNRSGYFNHINFSKTSLDITVNEKGSSLDISPFDVVLQNVTARRAQSVGIDAASVLEQPSPKLSLTSSGFGRVGPWADYRAYGHNVHAFSGVTASTRNPLGEMADMGVPLADVLTSVALNAWVLAWALAPAHDSSVAVDISMAELMAAQLTDLLSIDVEQAYLPAPSTTDIFVRMSGSNRLVAVTLRGHDEVERFESMTGQQLPHLKRRGQIVDIRTFDDIASVEELDVLLRAAGIRAALVLTAAELAVDPYLRSTGVFQPVTSEALGTYEVVGLPWSFVGHPRAPLTAAPERP
ncbi:CoA transferase [Pseudarthrobacter oxydans]|uniref:CoA transferase n=1 Tax=Pseudarthrobacter oxydans TaxID=1671 RepID=UPI003D28EAA0